MNTATCNCHSQSSTTSVSERPRYYARQLVTPDDLTLEQDYFRTRLRRHNRYLHGWGVVCGAEVVPANYVNADGQTVPRPWKVIVKAGYVLGPYGDEIFVETDQCVDVRKLCITKDPSPDDECIEAYPTPPPTDNETGWLAIRYVEKETRLIKIPLGGCGCEDRTCEYTRFRDDYEICVIDHCPDSHKNPPADPTTGIRNGALAPICPECQDEPWVVLSAFTVDENGNVVLRQCDCRRQVVSFGNSWWTCSVPANELAPSRNVVNATEAAPAQPAATQPAVAAQPAATGAAQPARPVVVRPGASKAPTKRPGASKAPTKRPATTKRPNT